MTIPNVPPDPEEYPDKPDIREPDPDLPPDAPMPDEPPDDFPPDSPPDAQLEFPQTDEPA